MKARLFFLFILAFISLPSCLDDGKMVIEKNNTIVYYDNQEDEIYATKVINFWIDNKYDGKRKQSLKISKLKDNKSYLLKVIVREDFKSQNMPFEDIKLFYELQTQLNKEIFVSTPCQIAVCDKYFNVLTIPNKISP